ncbi:MAG: GH32 C-terminal domain-containing protein [Muribaculaceae bacterium]|nr:GH32 C-terminal domain-containing protein [Muribaculaceae bacterium]
MKKYQPILISLLLSTPAFSADLVTSVPMETDGLSRIKESVGGQNLRVQGRHTDENMPGAVGSALRFDGYSTYVEGNIPAFEPAGASSFSVWVAPETYPIVEHDLDTPEKITIAGTINNESRSGWAFSIDKHGKYSFDCYAGGWLATAEDADKGNPDLIPTYEWSHLVAVNDPEAGTLTLYRNGDKIAETKSLGPVGNGNTLITIGKTAGAAGGDYQLKTFNGLIDEVNVYDGILSETEISATPENNIADLSIPDSRFAKDLLRPKYHGMPGANWTNETHGMTYSDGRYHVFFQKNANGPYMSRLHWGHISSENLYDWTEEKIAIAPGEYYDTKGCWSGCVFTDEEITGGLPNILYTGVDYALARIVQAVPSDETLLDWEKTGVVLNGKPTGLSDDFRDPYFFREGDNAYIIVGTSKDGLGATTLHKYNPASKTWTNDGSIFFMGSDKAAHGTFWEMPNITKMDNGKWLFTCTPQGTSADVHVLCWTGEIAADGTFVPDNEDYMPLELIEQRQGYGLLSPTIYQHDGKTILMGIVPDKLPTSDNCSLGWAHLYSLPREISLDENGSLVQKPYSGLAGLRADNGYSAEGLTLDGTKAIEGVGGRQFEIKGEFEVGDNPFGFNLFKNSKGAATLSYNPSNNKLELNLTGLNRKQNDRNSYGGRYVGELPEQPEKGSIMTIDVWVDGSIMDIFVNDKWASSVRVFPTDNDADGLEIFSKEGQVKVNRVEAWLLGDSTYEGGSGNEGGNGDEGDGIEAIIDDLPEYVDVVSLNGTILKKRVKAVEALDALPKGIYIVNGYKVVK